MVFQISLIVRIVCILELIYFWITSPLISRPVSGAIATVDICIDDNSICQQWKIRV